MLRRLYPTPLVTTVVALAALLGCDGRPLDHVTADLTTEVRESPDLIEAPTKDDERVIPAPQSATVVWRTKARQGVIAGMARWKVTTTSWTSKPITITALTRLPRAIERQGPTGSGSGFYLESPDDALDPDFADEP